MSNWKTIVAIVILAPFVALLGGVGILCYQIGQHWDARSTDSLIAGLVATCGGGVLVICVLLAIIIGVPLAVRILREAGHADKAWRQLPPCPPSYPTLTVSHPSPSNWAQKPPRLEAKQGSWHRLDNAYDTWEDEALNH
jgi:hypothetical protein